MHFQRHRMVVVAAALLLGIPPASANPAQTDDKAGEYDQVRKIAMRDPKVRAAFDKANEKLDRRIIEIDPSLKAYVERNKSSGNAYKPADPASTQQSRVPSRTHMVAKGETLSSIARRYKTTVAQLKSANHITDERRLKVGQQLVIPSAKNSAASPEGDHASWGKIKPDF